MRKSLRLEVSPQEMEYLRESEGLTNKQIADRLGCSVNTVYRYIGKRSYAIANAQAQNKPSPVPEHIATGRYEEGPEKQAEIEIEEVREKMKVRSEAEPADAPAEAKETRSQQMPSMPVLKERRIVEFKGDYCVYEVDTGDKSVVMKDGEESALVTGMMDAESLGWFIRELMQVHNMLKDA